MRGCIADRIEQTWRSVSAAKRFLVFTGGEPLLQLERPLIDAMHERGFEVAVETNGTVAAPEGLDWIEAASLPWCGYYVSRSAESS